MKKKRIKIYLAIIIFLSIIVLSGSLVLALVTSDHYYFQEKLINSQSFSQDEVKDLNLDIYGADIKFSRASDDLITVNIYSPREKGKIKLEDNALNVTYNDLDFCYGFCDYNDYVEIFVPDDYLENLKIYSSFGDIIASSLKVSNLTILADEGNVDLGSIENADIRAVDSDINIFEVTDKISVNNIQGDIALKNVNIKNNSVIKTLLGSIEINNVNDVYIDADTDGKKEILHHNPDAKIVLQLESSKNIIVH